MVSVLGGGEWNHFNLKSTMAIFLSGGQRGIFLSGVSGDGKTHYMTGFIQALLEKAIKENDKPYRFKILSAMGHDGLEGIFTRAQMRDDWALWEIEKIFTLDILFIDDLGEEKIPKESQVFESGLENLIKQYQGKWLITSNLKIGDPNKAPTDDTLKYDMRIRRRLNDFLIQMLFAKRR